MRRSQILLSSLAAVLAVALFWFFGYQPQREALAEVEDSVAAELAIQEQLRGEVARLRMVRAEAPEIESQLAAAYSIVPRDAALPASLRQLQLAADESGVVLDSVNTARPAQGTDVPEGLSSITLNMHVLGNYFQVVDFLRRVEDPLITPRGVLWSNMAVAVDEYPVLSVNLTGELFAAFDVAPPPAPEGTAEGAENEAPGTDVEVGDEPVTDDVDMAMEADR